MIRIWLDDVRVAPRGWTRTKSVVQTIDVLQNGHVDEISLDYDLDFTDGDNKGVQVLEWILWAMKKHRFRSPVIHIHSANPKGAAKMTQLWQDIELRSPR